GESLDLGDRVGVGVGALQNNVLPTAACPDAGKWFEQRLNFLKRSADAPGLNLHVELHFPAIAEPEMDFRFAGALCQKNDLLVIDDRRLDQRAIANGDS